MSQYFVLASLFIIILTGCTPKNFIVRETSSLTFYLQKSEANRVQFAASFDHFTLHDARQNGSGLWQVKVPVNYELKYFYIVDGLIYIPECHFKEKDDFGAENCLYLPDRK